MNQPEMIELYFQQKHELNKKVISFNQKGGYKNATQIFKTAAFLQRKDHTTGI
jgi:hypothetical protein